MNLQLTFENPSQISSHVFDRIEIQFKAPDKILIGKGRAAPSDLEIKQSVVVPRQLDAEKVEVI